MPKTLSPKALAPCECGARHWILVPSALRRSGESLMQQQCWCWGCDARGSDAQGENALLRAGFSRRRPPAGAHGSSTYFLHSENCSIALWAFGMSYREGERAIFIQRFSFAPRVVADEIPHIWRCAQMPSRPPLDAASCAAMLELWPRALQWMARYETEVLQARGETQRLQDLRGWNHRFVPPREVPAAWQNLATRVADCRVMTNQRTS